MPYALIKGGTDREIEEIVPIEIVGDFHSGESSFEMNDVVAANLLRSLIPAQSLAIQTDGAGIVYDREGQAVESKYFLMIAPVAPTIEVIVKK